MMQVALIGISLIVSAFASPGPIYIRPDQKDDLDMDRGFKTCMACTMGIGTVSTVVGSAVKMLMPKMSDYCDKVSNEDAKTMCKEFADKNGEAFVEVILAVLDPNTFCGAVGACW